LKLFQQDPEHVYFNSAKLQVLIPSTKITKILETLPGPAAWQLEPPPPNRPYLKLQSLE